MANTTVNIGGTNYVIVDQGAEPAWGSDQHDLLVAMANVITNISGPGDIPVTTFSPLNNVSSPSPITGAQYNISTILSSTLEYTVYRTTSTNELTEKGVLNITYEPNDNRFEMSRTYTGDAGMEFSIDGAGQINYTSSNVSGTSYTAELTFSAKSILQ